MSPSNAEYVNLYNNTNIPTLARKGYTMVVAPGKSVPAGGVVSVHKDLLRDPKIAAALSSGLLSTIPMQQTGGVNLRAFYEKPQSPIMEKVQEIVDTVVAALPPDAAESVEQVTKPVIQALTDKGRKK